MAHRVDVPLDLVPGRLPRVCVVTGSREDVIDHEVRLRLPWARAHRVLDQLAGGVTMAGGLALAGAGVAVRTTGEGALALSLPYSRAAARRQRVDALVEEVLHHLAVGGPIVAVGAVFFARIMQRLPGPVSPALLALPLVVLLCGLTLYLLHRLLVSAPAARLRRISGKRAVLELPSEDAADAIWERLQAEALVRVDCPACRSPLAVARRVLGRRRRCPECGQQVVLAERATARRAA